MSDTRLTWRLVRGLLAALLVARLAGMGIEWLPRAVWIAILLAAAHLVPAHVTARRVRRAPGLVVTHAFGVGLALVCALALLVRLPGYASDIGHVPLDIDEHRLAANIRHYFATGELLHDTVEHYPGAAFWVLAASSFLAYLRGLSDANVFYPVHTPVEMFVGASRLANIWIGAAIVLVTGLVGRRLAGPVAGLVSAAIVAIVPLSVETTVLVRNDPAMVLAAVATTGVALLLHARGTLWLAASAGALAGVAAGIKYSGVFAIAPVFIAAAASSAPGRLRRGAVGLSAFVLAVGLTNHFIWADFPNFLRQIADQIAITGPAHWAASDNPAAFHVMVLSRFGPGWPMLILAAAFAVHGLTGRRADRWIVLSFPLLYLWFMTGRPSQFPRWVFPLVPFVAVAGAAALTAVVVWLCNAARARSHPVAPVAWLTAAACAGVVLWAPVSSGAVSFSRRITPPTHTRVEAWLREHAAPGSVVLLGAGWLDLGDSHVNVQRVPDLGAVLDDGIERLAGYDWIVVPEIHFGRPVLTRLGLVHRVEAVRTFGGSVGHDFAIYAVPRLPGWQPAP